MLSLKLFGGASIEADDGPLTGPAAQRHRLALLALLAAAHPGGLSRDKLLAYLWPERDTEHARNLLSQAVHALRKALGEETILSAGEELRFEPGAVEADVVAFEEAIAAGDHERAAALYAGPFLDGFFLSDAPEFEHWVDGERERLRQAYAAALEGLAEEAAARGDSVRAVESWRRLAAEEPYSGRVTLRLMEALEAAGDHAGAIQQARLHTLLLQEEFEAEPDPQVAALAERLRTEPTVPAEPDLERAPAEAGAAGSLPGASAGRQEDARVGEGPAREEGHAPAPASSSWRSVAGVAAALLGLVFAGWAAVNSLGREPAEIRRIAVLPLANLTGDAQHDYFAAGMHDALIAELAQIGALTVYSRQSVLRYQGSDLPLPAIARELGVDALVEGSVFRSGDSVRITVQLVRARPEQHLWAASHHGALSHALSLQGEVARAIARAIRARVSPDVQARLARGQTRNPAAQQAYLRGLYHLERGSYGQVIPPSERLVEHRIAIGHLEEAAALDPEWAAAHAKLALAYHWLASGHRGEYEAEFYPKAKAAALRALALDETESQAHASLGFVLFMYEWDWTGAERAIRRALELDPNSHHGIYALYLQAAGRHDEAIMHFRMAEERNPLSEARSIQIANALACAGRHDEAIAQSEQLQARMRVSGDAHPAGVSARVGPVDFRGLEYSMKGMHAEAIASTEEAVAISDSLTGAVTNLAFVYARAGRLREARALADQVEEKARVSGRVWRPAHLYAALGDTERALDLVEEALAARRGAAAQFRCSLQYKLLRDQPRMQELLRPVAFP